MGGSLYKGLKFWKGKKAGPLGLQTWQSETASVHPERKYSNLFKIAKGNKRLTKGKMEPVVPIFSNDGGPSLKEGASGSAEFLIFLCLQDWKCL